MIPLAAGIGPNYGLLYLAYDEVNPVVMALRVCSWDWGPSMEFIYGDVSGGTGQPKITSAGRIWSI